MAPLGRACTVNLTTMACHLEVLSTSIHLLRLMQAALVPRLYMSEVVAWEEDSVTMVVQLQGPRRIPAPQPEQVDSAAFPTLSVEHKDTRIQLRMGNSRVANRDLVKTP